MMRLASLLVIVCTAALGQSGRLELPNVSRSLLSAVAVGQPSGSPNNSSIFQIRLVRDHASADTEEMPWKSRDGQTVPLPVEKTAVFDDAGVASAVVVKDKATGKAQLRITLTQSGSKRFEEITMQNIHKRIAIIIDGVLYEAPMIQAQISTDSLPIRDDFNEQQAEALARKINASVKDTSPSRRE
jgi:preprotein translocase subunit SecD